MEGSGHGGDSLVHDKIEQQLHTTLMDLLDQSITVILGTVIGVDILIIGDIITLLVGSSFEGLVMTLVGMRSTARKCSKARRLTISCFGDL